MSNPKLSVNLNKIALIRNSRPGNYPNVVNHGRQALAAGADGLTVHPRPDQRHIRPSDVRELAALVANYPGIEFNVEGNPFADPEGDYPGFMALVRETRPHQCTLVPDSDDQLTSDHGFDLHQASASLAPIVAELQTLGIRVSLFMDPDIEQLDLAKALGVERIELYTGPYAAAYPSRNDAYDALFERYFQAAVHARKIGLELNAGHDLNLDNLDNFCRLPGLLEVSIGHALTVDALTMGLDNAVNAYKRICACPRRERDA
ncbi:pyridoxine 5'-phosphate synthase [Marinimicrobium alkaliphilum]|uniref:pyridoxine 5'-phosphate synthase n=1 Tax=Marinimicrobium alkaliphilum TaxID=2202654 RepID=UPI000DB96B61|nr:pyridoxine 5'-phosphate synthase [Marinimicrobium alkaliphilum]